MGLFDIFKKDQKLPQCTLILTDSKHIIFQKMDGDHLGLSHVKIIENPVVVDQLMQLISKDMPLSKREGLTLDGIRDFLLD